MRKGRAMGEVIKLPVAARKTFTVGDLRKALAGCQNNMPVSLEIADLEEGTDLAQAFLRNASVETRCDDVERLYLWGSYDDDVEMIEGAEKCADCGSPYHTECP
jgi:hypothetical protein